MYDNFDRHYQATIGIDFLSKTMYLEDRTVRLQLWDTAGQERYQSLTPLYFRGAGAALLVYDVTKLHSYQTLQRWVRELKHTGPENVLLTIVGNKCDLEQERTVLKEDAEAYAESIGAVYLEASAKTGENVLQIFESIASRVSQEDRFVRPPDEAMRNDVLDLSSRRSYMGTNCC